MKRSLFFVLFLMFLGLGLAMVDWKVASCDTLSNSAVGDEGSVAIENNSLNSNTNTMADFVLPQEVPDPIEPVNRVFFTFNDKLYYWLLRPAAKAYGYVVPKAFRVSLDNFMYNTLFPVRFVNSIFQGNLDKAGYELVRFLINVVIGLGGLADAADECFNMNRDYSNEDFGQTLGYYGIGEVAYLDLPFYGPSSVRDAIGDAVDTFGNPAYYLMNFWTFLGYELFYKFNKLSLNVDLYDEIKGESFDPYIAVKNYYINYRRDLIRR